MITNLSRPVQLFMYIHSSRKYVIAYTYIGSAGSAKWERYVWQYNHMLSCFVRYSYTRLLNVKWRIIYFEISSPLLYEYFSVHSSNILIYISVNTFTWFVAFYIIIRVEQLQLLFLFQYIQLRSERSDKSNFIFKCIYILNFWIGKQ